jgi:hypothetical protein
MGAGQRGQREALVGLTFVLLDVRDRDGPMRPVPITRHLVVCQRGCIDGGHRDQTQAVFLLCLPVERGIWTSLGSRSSRNNLGTHRAREMGPQAMNQGAAPPRRAALGSLTFAVLAMAVVSSSSLAACAPAAAASASSSKPAASPKPSGGSVRPVIYSLPPSQGYENEVPYPPSGSAPAKTPSHAIPPLSARILSPNPTSEGTNSGPTRPEGPR